MTDDPVAELARALDDARVRVRSEVEGRGPTEAARATLFLLSAYDLAVEMWFQHGDPSEPRLTNWERPWRKYGGDNPTTTYLSAPVEPGHTYRLAGDVGDAVYVGVQAYTRGPGYNAPSANISDPDLLDSDGRIDLAIGGDRPRGGGPWLPLVEGDYLVMVRLCHRSPEPDPPPLSIERIDEKPFAVRSTTDRAAAAGTFFRDEILSTFAVTEALRAAAVNAYPPPEAPVHRPRYTGALFPTLDNVYDGCFVDLEAGQMLRLHGRPPVARYVSLVFCDRWFNTPDFPEHRCYRTLDELVLNDDGTYDVFVGPEDPGHPNWIDTAGLLQGIFAIRCLLPQDRHLPGIAVVPTGASGGVLQR